MCARARFCRYAGAEKKKGEKKYHFGSTLAGSDYEREKKKRLEVCWLAVSREPPEERGGS